MSTDWKRGFSERQQKDFSALFCLVNQTQTNPPRTQQEFFDIVEKVADLYFKRTGVRISFTPDRKAVIFSHTRTPMRIRNE
jgi:hypothetical protein